MQRFHDRYADSGLRVVLLEYGGWTHQQIESWLDKQRGRLPVLLGADRERLEKKYNIRGTPTKFILDENGRVLFRQMGYGPGVEKTLEAQIREALGMNPFLAETVSAP